MSRCEALARAPSRACNARICVSARRVGRRAVRLLVSESRGVSAAVSRRVVSQYADRSALAGIETAKGLSSSRPGATESRKGSPSRSVVSASRWPRCSSLLRPGIRHKENVRVFDAWSVGSMRTQPASSHQQGWACRPSRAGFSAKLQPPGVGREGQRIRTRAQPVQAIDRISAQILPGELRLIQMQYVEVGRRAHPCDIGIGHRLLPAVCHACWALAAVGAAIKLADFRRNVGERKTLARNASSLMHATKPCQKRCRSVVAL